MAKTKIGQITHYYDKIGVAVLKASAAVKVGDTIQIGEDETAFTQVVESMQVDHLPVSKAKKGDEVGLKITSPVKHHDFVYKV